MPLLLEMVLSFSQMALALAWRYDLFHKRTHYNRNELEWVTILIKCMDNSLNCKCLTNCNYGKIYNEFLVKFYWNKFQLVRVAKRFSNLIKYSNENDILWERMHHMWKPCEGTHKTKAKSKLRSSEMAPS